MSTKTTKKSAINSILPFDIVDAIYATPARELTVGILCVGGGTTVFGLGIVLIVDAVIKK